MSKQEAFGDGSVYFRKDRMRWVYQYYDVDPVTGIRKKVEKSFKTEEEAKAQLQAKMYQMENPLFLKSHGIPLVELMKMNLKAKYDTNMISDAQYDRVKRTIKKLEESAVVNKNIDEIKPEEIQRYVNTLSEFSDSTIKKCFEQFNQSFKYAFDRGYILRNPMAQVIRPKSRKQTKLVRAMTLDEETKFVEYLQSQNIKDCPYRNEFLIQLFMGLRIGECLALTTHDIDLMHRKIYVHQTLSHDIDGTIILSNSPKTQAGNRYLPIPDSLYPYIVEQMKYCESQELNEEKRLFKPPYNKLTNPENVNRALYKILNELGINHMSSHSLRHTYATRSIEAGVTPVVLQKLMGHTDVAITLNTYTSVFDKYKETELEKVNQYYMNQNLLQEPKPNNVLLEDGTKIVEANTKEEDDKLNETIREYER